METENIIRLIEAVEKAGLASFELKEGEFSLSMSSARGAAPAVSAAAAGVVSQPQKEASEMAISETEGLETVTGRSALCPCRRPGEEGTDNRYHRGHEADE